MQSHASSLFKKIKIKRKEILNQNQKKRNIKLKKIDKKKRKMLVFQHTITSLQY